MVVLRNFVLDCLEARQAEFERDVSVHGSADAEPTSEDMLDGPANAETQDSSREHLRAKRLQWLMSLQLRNPRQRDVLALKFMGKTNLEIATALGVSTLIVRRCLEKAEEFLIRHARLQPDLWEVGKAHPTRDVSFQ